MRIPFCVAPPGPSFYRCWRYYGGGSITPNFH